MNKVAEYFNAAYGILFMGFVVAILFSRMKTLPLKSISKHYTQKPNLNFSSTQPILPIGKTFQVFVNSPTSEDVENQEFRAINFKPDDPQIYKLSASTRSRRMNANETTIKI